MRKHLRGEKPFEQPIENILTYQYDVNNEKAWPVVRRSRSALKHFLTAPTQKTD